MAEPRTRVRKPDAQTAEKENIVVKEPEVVNDDAKTGDFNEAQRAEAEAQAEVKEDAVEPAELYLPFRREGFHLVDARGRRIALCGVDGDVVRTGPGIAEAIVRKLSQ